MFPLIVLRRSSCKAIDQRLNAKPGTVCPFTPMFGFICCDKPLGMTSRDVVNVVQRRIRPVKVGHAGTLDPLAQGVLVLGVGPAVRLVPYVQQQPKRYLATFRLGQSSASGDLEGELTLHANDPVPSLSDLRRAAEKWVGEIEQTPPAHSAVWVDGKRAYRRVRAGESVDMPSRRVTVHRLDVLRYDYPEADLDIVCGSGTYIRSLGIDLAKEVGSNAVMSYLRRIGIGKFSEDQAVSIAQLREQPIEELLLSPLLGVDHLFKLAIDNHQSELLGHGRPIDSPLVSGDEAIAVTGDGQLRAIVRRKRDAWWPYRVFPVS